MFEDCISGLQISLVLLVLNGTAKTKLAILAFLCNEEFVKISIGSDHLTFFTQMTKSLLSLWMISLRCVFKLGSMNIQYIFEF